MRADHYLENSLFKEGFNRMWDIGKVFSAEESDDLLMKNPKDWSYAFCVFTGLKYTDYLDRFLLTPSKLYRCVLLFEDASPHFAIQIESDKGEGPWVLSLQEWPLAQEMVRKEGSEVSPLPLIGLEDSPL